MRFFHLSDLHLGIKLYEHDLLKDQKAILDEIVALTRQYQPDAVVFAGDIYDRSVPPVEAVALFDDFMTQLRAALPNGEIMLISGNHDSAQRLDVFRSELSDRGIHMIGKKKAETAASQAAEKERQAQKAETDCETQIRRLNEEMPQKQANAEEFNQQYQQTMAEKSLDEAQWQALTETYPDVKIADRLQEEAEAFKEKKTAAEEKRKTAQNAIAGREKPNIEQLNAASTAAESALKEVSDALEAAKHLHSDNAKVLKDLREGRDPLAKACQEANTAQHLSDVMAGSESGNRMNLETFVQRSYMEKILCDANRRFRDMSNGQFELKLINVEDAGEGRNKGLDLEVYSIVTGKTRSVNTLSGGESFMAALSLALGMADQIQAATAAIHLDVMFIDEGFGSLSDNARNEAVNILKEMAGKQRQIGIISHVSELKDEIENQLIVKKDDRGSHISWR